MVGEWVWIEGAQEGVARENWVAEWEDLERGPAVDEQHANYESEILEWKKKDPTTYPWPG